MSKHIQPIRKASVGAPIVNNIGAVLRSKGIAIELVRATCCGENHTLSSALIDCGKCPCHSAPAIEMLLDPREIITQ